MWKALERQWYSSVRGERSRPKTLAVFFAILNVCVVCLLLFITEKLSFEEAGRECESRHTDTHRGAEVDDFTHFRLSAMHLFGCVRDAVSLAGFVTWLFFSPHLKIDTAVHLDRKLGSRYAVKLFGGLLFTASSLSVCSTSVLVGDILLVANLFLGLGVCVIASNFLTHKYLDEKASIITKL